MDSGNPSSEERTRLIEKIYERVSSACGREMTPPVGGGVSTKATLFRPLPPDAELAPLIDHTLLKPEATPEEIRKLCAEATEYRFASVCVNPVYVRLAGECVNGSSVKVCSVVGFPLGATTTSTKAHEAAEAVASGAIEIDMVMAVGRLKAGDFSYVLEDIEGVVGTVRSAEGGLVKVIIEACLLSDEEKIAACAIARAAGAGFVKTSTGFAARGATEHDVWLMREAVGSDLGVKASGGVRDREAARRMIAAGATRLGTSASIVIVGRE